MGASFLLDAHDMGSCLFFWHKVRMTILMRMRMRIDDVDVDVDVDMDDTMKTLNL